MSRNLNNHLILHSWLNDHFGYTTTRDLLNDVKNAEEGFTADGQSAICEVLLSRPKLHPKTEALLSTYDTNIKRHLAAINDNRREPIILRYFQYLALLYAEIFLDWKLNRPAGLLRQLNDFVQNRNSARPPGDVMDTRFEEQDLDKLAFWMATGAGKTLLMHINYHQYLHYYQDTDGLDHIILITPNEGLSEQHMREMESSGIPVDRFNIEGNRSEHTQNVVKVIEITKLVEAKRGGGVSVPVEAFEGNNLIFVDEGHKGSGGKVWRKYRDDLAETGFTFEYSATFGQALAAANNADLIDEYGKSIVFDYSYRYFYEDGYGKNFRILNIAHDEATQTDTLLSGNLLSFYEQKHYFKRESSAVHAYGLDSPLWAFVGSRVNAVYENGTRSDVLNVILFLDRFLRNEKDWAVDTIEKILQGNSGLRNNNTDIFSNRFDYLKGLRETPAQIYTGILKEVFHTDSSGALHLYEVRKAPGEIALKTTHGHSEFGLIYIGDTSNFKKLVEGNDVDLITDPEDVLTESLFSNINTFESSINILIGARKFIEGWDSWRVSAMGLLNIGRNEGSQIIQLFGRGVRLRGKDMTLRRSSVLDGEHPENLSLLETLNIFAVRANFMAQFREYLLREGVPPDDPIQLEIPIKLVRFPKPSLYIPKVESYKNRAIGQCVKLNLDPSAIITYTTQSVEIIGSSSQANIQRDHAQASLKATIPEASLARVNWENIYLQLLEYKQEKQFHNLIFDTEILRHILTPSNGLYELYVMDDSEVNPRTQEDVKRLEELVLILLRKYIDKFYRIKQRQWNNERIELDLLGRENRNFTNWNVSIPYNEANDLQPQIEQLINNGEIYQSGMTVLPNIYTDRHLYQPLLTIGRTDAILHAVPPALVESEEKFVEHLKCFVDQSDEILLENKQVFLLRNQSRGKGVGFYDNEGFYPDFILWILQEAKQRIVFVEPHGMIHEPINNNNFKITLFKRLRQLSLEDHFRNKSVEMDSFIVSKTPFEKLRHRVGIEQQELQTMWHILFPDDVDPTYLSPIFKEFAG